MKEKRTKTITEIVSVWEKDKNNKKTKNVD